MQSPPLIAVTSGSKNNFPNRPEMYIQSVKRAGGIAEFVYPGSGKSGLVDHYDGFLVPGGKDISPLRYNEKQQYDINPEEEKRTDFELSLLGEFLRRKKPVFGICYGMQLINVFFCGTLYQDIQDQRAGAYDHRVGGHEIDVHRNPYLKTGMFDVNSSHHQAVKEAGRGCIPFAFAHDGTIEGIYHTDYPFCVGVQWHPERMTNEISETVFEVFVEACRDH